MMEKVAGALFEQRQLDGNHSLMVDGARGDSERRKAIGFQPAAARQILERDEQGIARER